MEDPKCPICHLDPPDLQVVKERDYGEQIVYNCARCGKFLMTQSASAEIQRLGEAFRVRLSAWVRMQTEFGLRMPDIRMGNGSLDRIKEKLPTYTPTQKQFILLRLLARRSKHPGGRISLVSFLDYPLAWGQNEQELGFYVRALTDMSLVDLSGSNALNDDFIIPLVVTPNGWQYLDRHPASGDIQWESTPEKKETKGNILMLSGASISSIRKLLYSQSRGQIKQILLESGVSPEKILPIQVTNDIKSPGYLSKEEIIQKMFDPIYGDHEKAEVDEILIKLVQVLQERGADVSDAVEKLRRDGIPVMPGKKQPKSVNEQFSDMIPLWGAGVSVDTASPHSDLHEYDVFICHASEDKEQVAEPLAAILRSKGKRVWLDKFVLRIGDSLLQKIDEGLARSRYGIVVLSPSFFGKEWPRRELDGLMQKETSSLKVILPVWHNVAHEEVKRYSPILAGKLAGRTENGIQALAEELISAMV